MSPEARARRRRRREAGPPDFIGVGAEGPGGAWWFATLLTHPEIEGPRRRRVSLDYFRPFCERALEVDDIAAYHMAFPTSGRTLRGEWSDAYMSNGWIPTLLTRAAPQARLLVMLSDPVARFRAVHAERAAVLEPDRRIFMTDVVDRCQYASHLARLRHYFPAERILVLQFERCLRDPAGEYARTLRFVGARDDVPPPRPRGALRSALARGRPPVEPPQVAAAAALWPDLEQALVGALVPDVEALVSLVPEIDLSLWPEYSRLAGAAP